MANVLASAAAFCGCTALGMIASSRKQKRTQLLKDLAGLIPQLQTRTAVLAQPIHQVITELLPQAGGLKPLLTDVAQGLSIGGRSLEAVWIQALENHRGSLGMLTNQDMALLQTMGRMLSAQTLQQQQEQMQQLQSAVQEQAVRAEQDSGKIAPLYQKLGILAGLAMAVVVV